MAGSRPAVTPAGETGRAPDRSRRPPPGPRRPLRLPTFRHDRLSNGLALHVAENHEVPEVSLRLVLQAGAAAEPDGRAGVAELTARLLTEGAGERDARGVAVWLDRLGAAFHASVSYDFATLSMHFLSEVTEEALDFLATVARQPRFEEEEVERVRAERLDEIERERDEPATVADHELIEAIYGSHPYGRPAAGTREAIERLASEEIADFHRHRYGAADAFLVACGDIAPEAFRAGLERRLGDWRAGEGRPPPPPVPERPAAAGSVLVDRPGSPQAEVRVGTVGAPYGAPDQFPIMVANAVLGGLFNSRLNMNLREEKGWTYGARTAFRFRRGAGPFVARTAVETPVTAPTFGEILAEIRGLTERPPSDEELRLAKNALTLSLPLQFETNAQVARRVSRRIAYGLPEDYWERFRDRVEAVTREDVLAVGERRLHADGMALVAVTDAATVAEALEALGPVRTRPGG